MKGSRVVIFAWLAAVAIIVWSNVKVSGKAPPASAFVGTGIVYPIAAAITALPFPSAGILGGTFAVGWTLNLVYMAAGAAGSSTDRAHPSGHIPPGQDQGQSNVVQMGRYRRKPIVPPGQIIQGG